MLVASLMVAAAQHQKPAPNRTETRKEPSRFSEQRKAEAEAKRDRRNAKRTSYR